MTAVGTFIGDLKKVTKDSKINISGNVPTSSKMFAIHLVDKESRAPALTIQVNYDYKGYQNCAILSSALPTENKKIVGNKFPFKHGEFKLRIAFSEKEFVIEVGDEPWSSFPLSTNPENLYSFSVDGEVDDVKVHVDNL